MNHSLSREDFQKLISGEIVKLPNGDQIALQDIGFEAMLQDLREMLLSKMKNG